ncbi:MAG: hypothetical protein KDD69_13320, partial [Bdellovibrionales bacterium]|nr:hypothetical protein [Bdellovibrionales bacterium]
MITEDLSVVERRIDSSRMPWLILAVAILNLLIGCSAFQSEAPQDESAPADSQGETEGTDGSASAVDGTSEASAVVDEPSTPENRQTEGAPPAEARELSSVEVLWQVPGEPVEKYHLRYGLEATNLTHQVEIAVSDLEKVNHPEFGPLFRYVISSVPADRT